MHDTAAAQIAALHTTLAERETALAEARERNTELAAKLAQAEEKAAEHAARSAACAAALAAVQGESAGLRDECDRALQTAAQLEDIVEAAQSAIDTLRARIARAAAERMEHAALAESERHSLLAECGRLAQERDASREECGRLAAQGAEWFDAAILAGVERVAAGLTPPGLRIGRYRLQIGPVRGRGSAMQCADRARADRQWARAARFYLAALEQRAPNRPAVWVQLGHALKEAGKTAKAEFAYRRAAQLNRRSGDALVPLGQLLRQQGREEEAAVIYRRALERAPSLELRTFLSGELAALEEVRISCEETSRISG
ncbi:MAG: hypothetical protein ACREFK_01775 [Stellaceae bacterium]